jgi:hypothetical protein
MSIASYCSTDPAAERVSFNPGSFDDSASWSIPEGRFYARTNSVWILTGWSILQSEDVFTLQGLTGSSPIPLTARLSIHTGTDMYCCAGGQSSAAIKLVHAFDDSNVVSVKVVGPDWVTLEKDTTLDLSFIADPGVPFRVAAELRCIAQSGASTADAHLEFLGVPPGAKISSCNGYLLAATPVLSTTWGRLKASYR